jgi:hypothetical protein
MIYGWAESGGSDIERLVFYANGRRIGEIVGSGESLSESGSEGEIPWTPPEPGEYLLQVEAVVADGPEGMSAPVRVCVLEFAIDPGTWRSVSGYEGPCEIPPQTVAIPVTGMVTMEASASPSRLTYPLPGQDPPCPEVLPSSIAFQVAVEDPRDEVALVVVYYSIVDGPASRFPGRTSTHPLVLTRGVTGREPRIKSFSGDTPNVYWDNLDMWLWSSGATEITWLARALDRSGGILVEEGPFRIPARSSCEPIVVPVPTATTTPTPS